MPLRRLTLLGVVAAAALAAATGRPIDAHAAADPLALANVFMGTGVGAPDFGTGGGSGATFPGATLPFGMAQFSPDTIPGTANPGGGYAYGDTQIRGFSLDHFSGAGCGLFGDVPILPTVAPVTPSLPPAAAPRFAHREEAAAPGFYSVTLDPGSLRAIRAELTATTRTADARFTFPRTRRASVRFDAGGSALGDSAASVQIDPRRREVLGTATSGGFCVQPTHYTIYFAARFGTPFVAHGTWAGPRMTPGASDATAASTHTHVQAGAYVTFDTRRTRSVEVAIGLSFTSAAEAQRNLDAEARARSFDRLRAGAAAVWRRTLGTVDVSGGTRTDRRLLFSSLYHAMLDPNVFSDVDGSYRGMDNRLHRARGFTMYTNISGWDVYRTQTQLMAMLAPRRAADVVRSLVADAQQSGCFPRWPYADQQTNVMVGDPSALIAADAYAFGARRFPVRVVAHALARDASRPCHTVNGDYTEREGVRDYLRLGYVPVERNTDVVGHTVFARDHAWGSTATTLEYALADFAIARLAAAAGDPASASRFRRRAGNWRTVLNPRSGYAEPRRADGSWLSPFDPAALTGFVEGNGAQYTWLVPQDVAGLVRALGGRDAVRRRLDRFFLQLNAGPHAPYAYLGNEPDLGVPWLYDWLGAPARTSEIVRAALSSLYAPTPGGMPGNDDGGTMGAWWVFASLGLYPAVPGTDILALNAPRFSSAVIRLPHGTLRIAAPGAGAGHPYIRALTVDGRPRGATWLSYAQLAGGARVAFRLSGRRDGRWGRGASSAPPSFLP